MPKTQTKGQAIAKKFIQPREFNGSCFIDIGGSDDRWIRLPIFGYVNMKFEVHRLRTDLAEMIDQAGE